MKTDKAAKANATKYTVADGKPVRKPRKKKVEVAPVKPIDISTLGCSSTESIERAKEASSAPVKKISPLEYVRKILGDVDDVIDEFFSRKKKVTFNIVKWFDDKKVTEEHVDIIRGIYEKEREEIQSVVDGKDKDLSEAYKFLTSRQKTLALELYNSLLAGCDEFLAMKQRRKALNRKVRVKKPISVARQIKSLKFKREDENYNLVSVSPEYIVGAQELWVFNTNTKQLTQFIAADRSGLAVKGSTLQNFDEKQSVTKRLRKPEESLKTVVSGGKVALRKLMPSLSTKPSKTTGRINAHCVLLKAVK